MSKDDILRLKMLQTLLFTILAKSTGDCLNNLNLLFGNSGWRVSSCWPWGFFFNFWVRC